ncbi:MAG: FAD-dependent oxidoreductase, partial [Oscillospiraceae bacterium]|nr:FAD-dependent oxidoreductase [Oscillospiraceae bacterium]
HIETTGVRFVLGTTVKEFSENTATLTNGDSIDFDILILAVGVRPNTELIDAIGGKVDRGIVTDDTQAVKGLSDIYAAGDCTKSHDITSNTDKMIAILPNAFMQGNVAGKNMAGGVAHYTNAFPMNAAGFFGLHIITAGSYSGEEHTAISESGYKNLFIADNKLKGFILMGDMINNAGIYTSLVREQTPLNEVDLALLLEKPALMAFPAEYRKEKLGGQR